MGDFHTKNVTFHTIEVHLTPKLQEQHSRNVNPDLIDMGVIDAPQVQGLDDLMTNRFIIAVCQNCGILSQLGSLMGGIEITLLNEIAHSRVIAQLTQHIHHTLLEVDGIQPTLHILLRQLQKAVKRVEGLIYESLLQVMDHLSEMGNHHRYQTPGWIALTSDMI